mgnify:CR=1 FL=1
MTNSEVTRLERLETIVDQQKSQIEALLQKVEQLAQALEQLEDEQDESDAEAVLADLENSGTISWEDLKTEAGL